MKKNLLYLLIGISAFFASCQDPEGVGVDTSRQGITSLTAIFTSGPYRYGKPPRRGGQNDRKTEDFCR